MKQDQQAQYPNIPLYNIQQDENLEYNKQMLYQNQNLVQNQLQQHQQLIPIIYHAQLVSPTDSYNHQQQITSKYVRDQTFEEQKMYLLKILMIFQLWSLLNFACIELLRNELYVQLQDSPDTLLICSFFMMIIFSFLGVQYRQISAIFLLCTFICYSIAFYTGIYLCLHYKNWLYQFFIMAGALAVNFGLYIPCRSDE